MTRGGTVLHLTDAHDRFDRRVLTAVAADGPQARLDVLDRTPRLFDKTLAVVLVSLWLVPALLVYGPALSRIARRWKLPRGGALSGTKRLVEDVSRALAYVRAERAQLPHVERIRANDQACGLAALIAWRRWGIPYIYDAHEMVPFRNRNYGLARRSVEAWLERRVLRSARERVVVNRPIRRFYRRFYGVADIGVRVNDFFRPRDVAISDNGEPCVLYVGAAGGGRLVRLAGASAQAGCRMLLAVDRPAVAEKLMPAATVVGLEDYEAAVEEALAGTAPYMWCHLDGAILSYRFALPNKFFQAMAFGMPIVAAPGTYLARIVRVHGVGVVAGGDTLDAAQLWDRELYAARRAAVRALRLRLAETKELL